MILARHKPSKSPEQQGILFRRDVASPKVSKIVAMSFVVGGKGTSIPAINQAYSDCLGQLERGVAKGGLDLRDKNGTIDSHCVQAGCLFFTPTKRAMCYKIFK